MTNHNQIKQTYQTELKYQRKFGDAPAWLDNKSKDALHRNQAIRNTASMHNMTATGVKRIINK